jgi:predicted phosphodiesterase
MAKKLHKRGRLIIDQKDYSKQVEESNEEYIYRICSDKDVIGSWQDVADIINKELGLEYTESKYRKSYQAFQRMFEANKTKFVKDEYIVELQNQQRNLQKERYKLQTEKLENNRWLRENARDELIIEKIVEAINNLEPLKIPEVLPVVHGNKEYTLIFGDEHYGVEFEIKGLFNEVLNAYSPEIFEDRMWDLLDNVIEIVHKEGVTKLNVFSMGDYSDGLLRVGQLMKLRYGIVEGTVRYADFICNWLNRLSEYVNIEFQMVSGNHTELRMLGQPKGTFKNENMSMVVSNIIKSRLATNPNFNMVENPTGMIFTQLCGLNILGIHGEVKDMEKAIKDFSSTYKIQIDILIAGHLHHSKSETVGVNSDVINAPSIIGVDDYSLSLNKTSNAGATLLVFEDGKGKVQEYNIKLN